MRLERAQPTFMVILTVLCLEVSPPSKVWAQAVPKPQETGTQLQWVREEVQGETIIQLTMEGLIPSDCKNTLCSMTMDCFYFVTDGGLLRKIALPSYKEERQLEFKRSIGSLWLSREGLVLITGDPKAVTRDTQLWLIDPVTLAVKRILPAEGVVSGATTPGWSYMLTISGTKGDPSGTEKLCLFDLKTGKIARQYSLADIAKEAAGRIEKIKLLGSLASQGNDLKVSPDGKYLFTRPRDGSLCRFQIRGVELTYEEMGPNFLGECDFSFSADSMFVAISAMKGSAAKDHPDPGQCGVYIYKIENLQRPVVSLPDMDFLGFGKDNRFLVRTMSRGSAGQLVMYDSAGTLVRKHSWCLPDSDASKSPVSQCFVHPQRSRLFVRDGSDVKWYELKER